MEDDEHLDLPRRIFTVGEEPNGQRVNSYLKPDRIRSILNALDDDEVKQIRESSFGKLVSTADEPPFSGAFAQFIITRMLQVKKKHEIWFLFAGWPIRVSLREFAIVTGLPCGQIPKQNKKKKRDLVEDKKYWGELFGCYESLTVDKVVRLLKKRIVTDKKRRIKYAYLALTSSVLCPSSHFPKILDEHVELIRDLDYFLSYPWGRVSYDMVVSSIKSKDVVALSQKSVAVQGFFHAFQLVMVEAVPELLEVVEVGQSSSSSESESASEDESREHFVQSLGEVNQDVDSTVSHNVEQIPARTTKSTTQKVLLSPGHARDIDDKCEAFVKCIIPAHDGVVLDDDVFVWTDEVADVQVNTMLELIGQGFHFQKNHFRGGATAADIERMRIQKREAKDKKDKDKVSQATVAGATVDHHQLAEIVAKKVKAEFRVVEANVSACLSYIKKEVAGGFKDSNDRLERAIKRIDDTLMAAVSKFIEKPQPPCPDIGLSPVRDNVTFGNVRSVDVNVQMRNRRLDGSCSPSLDDVVHSVLRDVQMPVQGVSQDGVNRETQSLPRGEPEMGDNITSCNVRSGELNVQKSNGRVDGCGSLVADDVLHSVLLDVQTSVQEDVMNGESLPLARGESQFGDNLHSGLNTLQQADDAEAATVSNSPMKTLKVNEVGIDVENNLRKSKRLRTQSCSLQGFTCSTANNQRVSRQPVIHGVFPDVDYDEKYERLLQKLKTSRLINVTNGTQISSKDILDIAERTKVLTPKVVDALVHFSRILFMRAVPGQHSQRFRFFNTKFVGAFMKHYPKFSKLAPKDRGRFVFQEACLEMVRPLFSTPPQPERLYFSFLVDKAHWVGVCVDISAKSIQVLDCNTQLRSDYLMKKDLTPVAVMLPYLIKSVVADPMFQIEGSFSLDRARGVPHNPDASDSAVTTILLIGAHSMVGFEGCKTITPEVLPLESKRLAVVFFQEFGGSV